MGVKKIRFPETSGIGIKPISREGTERLMRALPLRYALRENRRKSVTLVHKGNIMKFTEGAFRQLGLRPRRRASSATSATANAKPGSSATSEHNPNITVEDNAWQTRSRATTWMAPDQQEDHLRRDRGGATHSGQPMATASGRDKLLIKDAIADITLQQVLTRAKRELRRSSPP